MKPAPPYSDEAQVAIRDELRRLTMTGGDRPELVLQLPSGYLDHGRGKRIVGKRIPKRKAVKNGRRR